MRNKSVIGVAAVALLIALGAQAGAAPRTSGGSLALAVQDELADQVATRLRAKEPVNSQDETGITPLAWAVVRGNVAIAKQLLDAGANPNLADVNGVVPLTLAVQNEQAPMVSLLLEKGASPNAARSDGVTPLMLAIQVGSTEMVSAMLARGANVNVHETTFDQTPLMWAAGKPELVRMLLDKGADTRAVTKNWQVTAINFTPSTGTLGNTGIPWNNKGDFKLKQGGLTALHFAVQDNSIESVKMLLDAGMDVNQPAADGTTPLLTALYKWRVQEQPVMVVGAGFLGPKYSLKFLSDVAMANLLLDRGAKVNVADEVGYTPLHGALLNVLLRSPQGGGNLGYSSRRTGARVSAPRGAKPANAATALKTDAAADQTAAAPPAPPPAAMPPRPPGPVDDPAATALVARMLEAGANPNAATRLQTPGPVGSPRINPAPEGSSPLLVAVATHNAKLVSMLLAKGANPNLVRNDGHSPLSVAVVLNDLPITQMLIESGGNIKARFNPDDDVPDPVEANTQRRRDQTLLHLAGGAGSIGVIEYLVSKGADPSAKNDIGETPLAFADAQERFRYAIAKENAGPNFTRETQTSDMLKRLTPRKLAAQ